MFQFLRHFRLQKLRLLPYLYQSGPPQLKSGSGQLSFDVVHQTLAETAFVFANPTENYSAYCCWAVHADYWDSMPHPMSVTLHHEEESVFAKLVMLRVPMKASLQLASLVMHSAL